MQDSSKEALPSSPKGEIVGIMAKVLSLMATHTGIDHSTSGQ